MSGHQINTYRIKSFDSLIIKGLRKLQIPDVLLVWAFDLLILMFRELETNMEKNYSVINCLPWL